MSAGFHPDLFDTSGEITRRCSIVSIYEDLGARNALLDVCDSLARQFKGDLEFKTDWWRFKYLADPEISMEAAHSAARADLILLSAQSRDLPMSVQMWFDGWLPARTAADGALVYVQSDAQAEVPSIALTAYLRTMAARGHLDYLWLGSSWSDMAQFQTGMDDLLAYDEPPPHWGINE